MEIPKEDVLLVLKHGRARIEQGWMKHAYHNDDRTEFCAAGALIQSTKDFGKEAVDYALHQLHTTSQRHRGISAISYNDRPSTTLDDILALYDETIATYQGGTDAL